MPTPCCSNGQGVHGLSAAAPDRMETVDGPSAPGLARPRRPGADRAFHGGRHGARHPADARHGRGPVGRGAGAHAGCRAELHRPHRGLFRHRSGSLRPKRSTAGTTRNPPPPRASASASASNPHHAPRRPKDHRGRPAQRRD
jgi:hypothetical protein